MESKSDREVELLKINLLAEELRTSFVARIGLYVSLYVATFGGSFALLGLTDRLEVDAFVAVFLFGLLFLYRQIKGTRSEYDKQLSRLSSEIQNIEAGKRIGDLDALLKKFRE